MKQVEVFENYKIQEGTLKFGEKAAISFGCIGTIDASANVEEVIKKCEGIVTKKKKRVVDMTVAVTGHVNIPASRELMGLTNEGLKTGVYAYGSNTFSKPFVFTARVIDMDGNQKLIAFSNMENVKGLVVKVNNDVTEIEMDDFEFSALADINKNFYYEVYIDETEDEELKSQWLTNFSTDLVKNVNGSI